MFRIRTRILCLAAFCILCATTALAGPKVEAGYGYGPKLGLLEQLGQAYCAKAGCRLDWVKAGSGQSLDMLKNGEVDMIMVHAPAAEKKAVAEGWAGCPTLIGSNEFFIVGPANDPAADAYKAIADAKAKFYSRGDNSGTHKKELDTWKDAGITPAGDWYIVTKDFMTATLKRANDEGGYFMTDSSTWAAEQKNMPKLKVLFSGDKKLVNTYHALCGQKDGKPASETAVGFIAFVASPEGQNIIRAFGKDKHGEALYNDAAYAQKYVD